MGVGMEVLSEGLAFYRDGLGMERRASLVLKGWNGHILNFPGAQGTALVLVNWKDGKEREYRDVPVKLVFALEDPVATAENIKAANGTVLAVPAPNPEVGGVAKAGSDWVGCMEEHENVHVKFAVMYECDQVRDQTSTRWYSCSSISTSVGRRHLIVI